MCFFFSMQCGGCRVPDCVEGSLTSASYVLPYRSIYTSYLLLYDNCMLIIIIIKLDSYYCFVHTVRIRG